MLTRLTRKWGSPDYILSIYMICVVHRVFIIAKVVKDKDRSLISKVQQTVVYSVADLTKLMSCIYRPNK